VCEFVGVWVATAQDCPRDIMHFEYNKVCFATLTYSYTHLLTDPLGNFTNNMSQKHRT